LTPLPFFFTLYLAAPWRLFRKNEVFTQFPPPNFKGSGFFFFLFLKNVILKKKKEKKNRLA